MGPIIGITAQVRDVQTSGGLQPAHTVTRSYADAVLGAGGIPLLLPTLPAAAAPEIARRLDGVLLTGGGDIQPDFYGGRYHATMYGIDPDRDMFEIALVKQIAHRRLPTLAICRGLQVLNVALGGSLIEDLPSEVGTTVEHYLPGDAARTPHQYITIAENCRIARLVGTTEMKVNSIHHQAVRHPAPGLRTVAWGDDGVIEALEADDSEWCVVAVQWHPEHLVEGQPSAARLFNAVVTAAEEYRRAREFQPVQ